MQEFDSAGRRLKPFAKELTGRWLQAKVRPNVAATITLLQARRVKNSDMEVWVRGDEYEYEWAFRKIVHGLSSQYYGKAYRRHRKLIPSFVTLEGDGVVKRKHLHAGFRCPDHVDPNEFIGSVYYWALRSPWVMNDVQVRLITSRWSRYSSKDGSEALLIGALSF